MTYISFFNFFVFKYLSKNSIQDNSSEFTLEKQSYRAFFMQI